MPSPHHLFTYCVLLLITASALSCATLRASALGVEELPVGSASKALDTAWFPSRLHAYVWRNWSLIPTDRLAQVVGATPRDIEAVGKSMGLRPGRCLTEAQRRRAALTIIRRNWHLLPYDQMLKLLGWTPDEMAYTLREDDFFYIKLGSLKPTCPPLTWSQPTEAQAHRAAEIAATVKRLFPRGEVNGREPLFAFVDMLNRPVKPNTAAPSPTTDAPLRMSYSYFALYGDPLIDRSLDPYPDGYLARIAASGVNAVWLQAVLSKLAVTPWSHDADIDKRLASLRDLTERAKRHGIKVILYLNEPRSLPTASPVFKQHPTWRGVREGDYAALCTSVPEVRDGLRDAVASICKAVPDLGGFFTITGSENLTSCWSHGQGANCPNCATRRPAQVIADVNAAFHEGIVAASGQQILIAWDWGWDDAWADEAINLLPNGVALMSVSEWGLPIERGGVKSTVGEYSLSSIGPGPRAQSHWQTARKRGLKVVAKMQIANSWELSAVPYVPAVDNVATHFGGLHNKAGVDDIMLGWTLGGHPSPNLQAIVEVGAGGSLDTLAVRLHGKKSGPAVADFWRECSAAYREFPFHCGVVYCAPLQMGPANPLWLTPTGYAACMVGIPYDDLDAWRQIYPAAVFADQLDKVATGFDAAVSKLRRQVDKPSASLREDLTFAEAASIHFASVAAQSRYVLARRAGDKVAMKGCADHEEQLALRLHALQSADSRIGFEASNEYFYVPQDLVEKVINCEWVKQQQ